METGIEIIVTNSRTPIVRAGYANSALLIAPIAVTLTVLALSEVAIPGALRTLAAIAVALGALLLYVKAVARLSVVREELQVLCALHEVVIPLSDIERVTLAVVPTSRLSIIGVKCRKRPLPNFFYFVSPSTNCGSVATTNERLGVALRANGVAVT